MGPGMGRNLCLRALQVWVWVATCACVGVCGGVWMEVEVKQRSKHPFQTLRLAAHEAHMRHAREQPAQPPDAAE